MRLFLILFPWGKYWALYLNDLAWNSSHCFKQRGFNEDPFTSSAEMSQIASEVCILGNVVRCWTVLGSVFLLSYED